MAPFWEGSEKAGSAFPVLSSLQHSPLGPEQLSSFIHSQIQKSMVWLSKLILSLFIGTSLPRTISLFLTTLFRHLDPYLGHWGFLLYSFYLFACLFVYYHINQWPSPVQSNWCSSTFLIIFCFGLFQHQLHLFSVALSSYSSFPIPQQSHLPKHRSDHMAASLKRLPWFPKLLCLT